jgi:two-component system, sensor histidine kinase and response regulator
MNPNQTSKGDIFVVDDKPDNLRLLSAILTERSYEVRGVTNGSTALMGIQAQTPDLILLDIMMPEMDGYEVCRRLKANPQTQAIPIIFLSAMNEVVDKVKAFNLGGVDYITKPFQVEEVLARIENQLAIRRLQSQLLRSLEQEKLLNRRIEEMATLEERNRIARDIHDSLGHALVALNIQMETAIALWNANPDQAYEFLVEAKQQGSEALQAVRQSVAAIRSDPFQGKTLVQAIDRLLQDFYQTTQILPESQIELSQSLPQQLQQVIYRIVQEGLTNICKYAEASRVKLQITAINGGLLLILADNGRGFQCEERTTGYGLQGMRERVTALGGNLEIQSQIGAGCRIRVFFPRV